MLNVVLTSYSAFFILLLTIIYFSKKRVTYFENRVYSVAIIFSLVGAFLEVISGVYYFIDWDINSFLYKFITRLIFLYYNSWVFIFLIYVSVLASDNYDKKKLSYFISIFCIILDLLLLFLPFNYSDVTTGIHPQGLAVNVLFLTIFINLIIMGIIMIVRFRKIGIKRVFPLILFFVLGAFAMWVQSISPDVFLTTPLISFITFVTYFTIENPDVKMIEALDQAKVAAEKANRAKSDFLSNMSHEIRTPLNAIVGFSDCILEEESLEAAKNDAKDIKLASENLLEIVNGILDISKIEADKMEIVETDYNPVETLENVAKLVKPRIGDKPIEMVVNFAPDIPYMLHGDGGKLRQIVTNILTNAVKYTEEGRITFFVNCVNTENNSSLVISVEDTGRGIKPEQIDKLFTKFQRLDEDKNTTLEGTGLGLAITKRFVEMMGGKIIVQSKYGEGSKFTVYLNQNIVMLNKPEGALVNDLNNLNKLNEVDLTKARILVVDDNKINIKVILKLLSGYGINAEAVDNGFDCIDKVQMGNIYDLILLDDMMPRMSGVETLKKLRESVIFKIPVVALTANAITGMREKYLNDGFDDYLSKPIDKNELYRVLTTYIKTEKKDEVELPALNEVTVSDYTGKKALIVDDNKINIKIADKMLMPYNFEIDTCLSGQECLDKVAQNKYDVIFMDYMMPGMDGIETLQHLKENPEFNIPVICLTADAVEGAREKFLNAGFNEYVSKPLDKNLLDEAINKFVSKN